MRSVVVAVLSLCAAFACSSPSRDFRERGGEAGSGAGAGSGGKAVNAGGAGKANGGAGAAAGNGGVAGVAEASGGTGDETASGGAGGSGGDTGGSGADGGSSNAGSGGSDNGGTGGSGKGGTGGSDNGGTGGSSSGNGGTGGRGSGGTTGGRGSGGSAGSSNAGATSGGAGSGGQTDHTPPTVTATTPANGATGVVSTTAITITFSEPMDETAVEGAVSIAGVLAGDLTFSWNGAGTVLTIRPMTSLVYDNGTDPSTATAHKYTLTVATGATDANGNHLASAYNANFTTLRRITQSIAPTLTTAFFVPTSGSPGDQVDPCTVGEVYPIGHSNSHTGLGDTWWLLVFQTGMPSSIYGVESAELQGTQGEDSGYFYSSGGVVGFDELAYQAVNASVASAAVVFNFGAFASSYSASTSTSHFDITNRFAAEVGGGQRNFLYRLSGKNGPDNGYASLTCGTYFLNVTYTTP